MFLKIATLHEPAGRVIKRSQWYYFINQIISGDVLLKKIGGFLRDKMFEKMMNDKQELELPDFRQALLRIPHESEVRVMLRRFQKDSRVVMFLKSYVVPFYQKQ